MTDAHSVSDQPPSRNLRAVAPGQLFVGPRALLVPALQRTTVAVPTATCSSLAFGLVAMTIILQMSVSGNLLFLAGIPYDVPGGFPLFKFHPATYLAGFAMLLVLNSNGQPVRQLMQVASTNRGLLVFIAAMVFCMASSILSVGISGAAIIVESYISPWTLAVVLATCSARQLRTLATVFIAMAVLNAGLGIFEAVARVHLVPAYINGEPLPDLKGEFRPYALFDHPLTAAMVTMMAVFVLLGSALRPPLKALIAGLLLVALLAWGGRTALAATAVILLGLGAFHVAKATLTRNLSVMMTITTAILLAGGLVAVWFLTTQTSIGERTLNRLYFDDSASSRTLQFRILGLLDFGEAMFGVANTRLPELAYLLGLVFPFEDIENPWLLAYLQLGLFSFVIFVAGLLPMIRHLWRAGAFYGKVIVVGLLLVTSTSNSLGRKSNVLYLIVAAVYATRRPDAAMPLGIRGHTGPVTLRFRPLQRIVESRPG
jgi:hypothetical protein